MAENNNNSQICADVEAMTASGRYDEALETLGAAIARKPDADLLYIRGRLQWKLGRKADAMSDYSAAVAIDPSSPAASALEMAREIMDFYNHDMYNP